MPADDSKSPTTNPVGASENVAVMVAVSPVLIAAVELVIVTVGAIISMASVGVVPAPPVLPAASV